MKVDLDVADEVSDCGNVMSEHKACWRLDQRGANGESALHLAILFSAKWPKFRVIANALLKAYPKLAIDFYEGDEYYGKYTRAVM